MKEGPLLMFQQTEGTGEASLQLMLPVPEGEKLEGKDWTFGGKIEDPILTLMRPKQEQGTNVFGPDYTMTLRLTKHTRDSVEGVIDLAVKNPAGTSLKGPFKAACRKSPTTPITVLHGVFGSAPMRNRLPTGSSFGQSRRAIVWFTTTTGIVLGPSSLVNNRPRTSGVPIARK